MLPRIALALVCALACVVAACDAAPAVPDPSLAVRGPSGGLLYPDPETHDCATVSRCGDLTAEIARWAARTVPELGEPASVTFHGAIDDAGRHILLTRSGGGTWVAVVSWPGGTRRAVLVGCGVGVDPNPCFSEP
jgi:hypothetical protein